MKICNRAYRKTKEEATKMYNRLCKIEQQPEDSIFLFGARQTGKIAGA